MFDLGFSELLIIGVVALIVLGPERLPKVARTAGAWLGRLNRYVSQVKGDIEREMRVEELRKMQQEMKEQAQRYEVLADETGQELKREVEGVEKVVQAMAATDAGLSQREYDKDKAEKAAADALPAGEAGSQAQPAGVDEGQAAGAPTEPAGAAPREAAEPEVPATLLEELPRDDAHPARPEADAVPTKNH